MDVTESQLATALERFCVGVRTATGGPVHAEIADADETARGLYVTLARMAALREDEPEPGQPRAAAVTRERLIEALTGARVDIITGGLVRQGEIAQPHSFASYLYDCLTQPGEDAERCPECGTPLTMHHDPMCTQPSERCEARKTGTDPELAAIAALLPALPLVAGLGPDARERVMDWARRRACDGQPPF
jgi:hypothetical protein